MGAGVSADEKQTAQLSKRIERQMLIDFQKEREIIKLLLLGAGECGKSTILKQMRILHNNGFSETDLRQYRDIVRQNVLTAIKDLVGAMKEFEINFASNERQSDAAMIFAATIDLELGSGQFAWMAEPIRRIWLDEGTQQCFREAAAEIQLNDTAKYFLDAAARIFTQDYVPTQDDILRVRIATTGVVKQDFKVKDHVFSVFDVGGQRSERKKWIHCFDNVQAIIFLAAISDYDEMMRENKNTNRLLDSMELFETIINRSCFIKTCIILFLNKKDLFEEKLLRKPISVLFPDYEGGSQDFQDSANFIQDKFLCQNAMPSRKIFSHLTCATDTKKVQLVIDVTIHTILSQAIKGLGIG